jgi:DNA-directed RNA polymerase subunit RPC12/RpoP
MILNATNNKTIAKLFKTPYIEQWTGRKIQIYTEKVKAFGEVWDALRIRPFLPVEKELICADCGKKIEGNAKSTAEVIAKYSLTHYGRMLCNECGKKAYETAQKASEDKGVLG